MYSRHAPHLGTALVAAVGTGSGMTKSESSVSCPCCAADQIDAWVDPRDLRDGGSREVDERVVARLVRSDEDLGPLLVDAATYRIVDGQHRLLAHRAMGTLAVPVRFVSVPVSKPGRVLAGLAANRCHGRELRPKERSAVIRQIIRADPGRSNGQIHRATGASKSCVQAQRERVEAELTGAQGVKNGPPDLVHSSMSGRFHKVAGLCLAAVRGGSRTLGCVVRPVAHMVRALRDLLR